VVLENISLLSEWSQRGINSLSADTDFSSLSSFKRCRPISTVGFSKFLIIEMQLLKCFTGANFSVLAFSPCIGYLLLCLAMYTHVVSQLNSIIIIIIITVGKNNLTRTELTVLFYFVTMPVENNHQIYFPTQTTIFFANFATDRQ